LQKSQAGIPGIGLCEHPDTVQESIAAKTNLFVPFKLMLKEKMGKRTQKISWKTKALSCVKNGKM
jgi:hypothetical protein